MRMFTDPEATLTHQEIMERFRRLFGREMTPVERSGLFLPAIVSEVPARDRPLPG
jgi:hypothetical protein